MSTLRKVEDTDVSELRKLLCGSTATILVPGDEDYGRSLQSWSRAAEQPAGIAIEPTKSDEVAVVVKYANEQGIDLAVRGGGHSTAGTSSTNGGILINLRRMRNVEVDPQERQISVDGGCLWLDVDNAAWEHGLAVVGGTVADTGVGGLTLGGGYGFLTGEQGLVIDNLVEATVVLASGEIVKASREINKDLFWALAGAGQNFGVVTQFVFKAHPQGESFSGVMIFPPTPEVITGLTNAFNDMYTVHETTEGPRTKVNKKASTVFGLIKPPDAGGQTLLLMLCNCTGTEEEGKKLFKPFFDLNPVHHTMKSSPWPTVNNNIPTAQGQRVSMKGAGFVLPVREAFIYEMIDHYNTFLDGFEDAHQSLIAWEFYDPVTVTQSDVGCFANRGYQLNALIMPMWKSAENDQKCRQWARQNAEKWKAELEEHGRNAGKGVEGGAGVRGSKGAVMLYGNYDQLDERSKDLFGVNYERLQDLKTQYDPKNLFNKLIPIQPRAVTA